MYEELIRELRETSACFGELDSVSVMLLQAADAIEELQEDIAALNGTVSNLIGQIEELSKPRWIPVTERLPEKRKWVLCRCEAGITDVLRYENAEWYHDPTHVYFFEFVTHWMPLPKSPKEAEDG